MITYDELEKRWQEKPYRWCEQHALTIADDGVLLGSYCVICKGMAVGEKRFIGGSPRQRMNLNVDGQEGRILALLSLAYGKLIHPNVIRHFRNAARALAKGEHTLAAIHLCHAGLPRFEGDEKRLKLMFQAEQLLDDGMEPGELLKGLDMDMLPAQISGEQWSKYVKAGFNPDEPRDDHGRWTDEGGSDADQGQADSNVILAADVTAGTPRKPGDISAETGQKIVDEAAKWKGTDYAPGITGENGDKAGRNAVQGEAADCSGSVYRIMNAAGVETDYAWTGAFAGGVESGKLPFRELGSDEDPQPGDVVLYPGHMAIYAGDDRVWSAHKPGTKFDNFSADYFHGTQRYFRPIQRTSI